MTQKSNKKAFEEGKSDGREERTIEIALRLKREDVPSDIIFRATGINVDTLIK